MFHVFPGEGGTVVKYTRAGAPGIAIGLGPCRRTYGGSCVQLVVLSDACVGGCAYRGTCLSMCGSYSSFDAFGEVGGHASFVSDRESERRH